MPDKKPTDAEVVKALEDWIKNYDGPYVNFKTLANTLDLINRLQAENERANNLTLEKCCENCIHEEKTLQAYPCCECFSYTKFTPKN